MRSSYLQIFTLIGVLISAGPAAATGLEFYAEIRGQIASGELGAAEQRLEEAFLADPAAAPEDRIALLETLAEVQIAAGKYSDAGDTLSNKAALLARLDGPTHPDLGPIHTAAGRAYLKGGNPTRAVAALEAAIRVDQRYLPCEGASLAQLYTDLAEALRQDGRPDGDAERLATDPDARCEAMSPTRSLTVDIAGSEAAFALVRTLYATDRTPTGSSHANEFYGAERGTLTYGEVEVSIPRAHKPGNIESPSLFSFSWEENPDLHIVLMDVSTMSEAAFFQAVGEALGPDDQDEIFVFIHGFNVTFAGAAKRTAQMVYDLNFTGVPIFYSWPSVGHPGSYLADAASVQVSARHLTTFLDDLVTRSNGKRIHIVAHSMGNRALTEALEIYALRHPEARDHFDQIIFAAPDVDSELFVYQTGIFERLARRMTLYTSDADLALSTSRQLHGNPRAGLADDAPLVAEAFDTIDMSVVGEGLLNHSYFAADASALSDVLWLFWRNPPPASRCGMVEEVGEAKSHWVYVPERCEPNVMLSALTLARLGTEQAMERLEARILEARATTDASLAGQLLQELEAVREVLADLIGL